MKRTAIAVSVCFGLAPSAASAFDWSIKATESETVELNSNQFLKSSPAGSVGSYSTITTNAEARTPTSKFDFDADGSYRKYWGPGVEGVASESLNYGFRGRYEATEKGRFDKEFVESAWRQQSTSLALLNDFGVATRATGYIDTLRVAGGIDRSVTARDTISLFATSTRTSYEPSSGGLPFTDTLARGSWRHNVSSITTLTASSEAELLDYDNASKTHVQIYRNQVGVDATLSAVLSFRINAGAAYLTTQGAVTGSPLIGGSGASNAAVTDWIGDAVLTYKVLKNTTLAVTASQSIGPSVVGSLFKRDTVDATLSQTINAQSSLSMSASVSRQIGTTTTDYASASMTYSYNFIRDWTASLTYRYQHRFASTGGTTIIDPTTGFPTVSGIGPADSNSIMVVVSNSFTILPRGN
ncbi:MULTISPECIES: hypothetical protein [Bradyrhizobium]|uniref:Outer membrane beta-barrel protein n=2 Tax=Bradyrhizobium TaxID=374 RepID=A0ABY0Q799_9BRAD|nr:MULTISPECIES: hypothetical protein [Bradyrhizobium]SDJ64137.1 hypothetical protein SAMN05444163_6015 [Bradyrhizobium ottawaense]SEC32436.1 hypothetical protein SAMN05444171_1145 [Bradyrhizobium lablabi]